MKKFKKIWKYLLGTGAGVILAGAVVGGVVSCSNGNTTTTQTQQAQPQPVSKPTSTKTTKTDKTSNTPKSSDTTPTIPKTTSDYQLTPQAQPGVFYNETLNPNTPMMVATTSTPNYLPSSQLQQAQGLDIYVGGILASVVKPNIQTVNLTLNLTKAIDGAQFQTMGNLIAFEKTGSDTPITLTPFSAGILREGTNSPWAVQFTLTGDTNPVDIDFPTNGQQITFTNVEKTINVDGVNINLNVDLSPFDTGKVIPQTVNLSKYITTNQTAMNKYLKQDNTSQPFLLSIPTPYPDNVLGYYSWMGQWNSAFNTTVDIPLFPNYDNGKQDGWMLDTYNTVYAYYIPINPTNPHLDKWQLQAYQYIFTGLNE